MPAINTIQVVENPVTQVISVNVPGLQGRPGIGEYVNVSTYSGFDITGATDSTSAVQAAVTDVENQSSPNYGKALYLPAAPNGTFKVGQVLYQYPFRLIGENWRTAIIKPASGSIPNGQLLFQFAGNQNNLLQFVTPLTITGDGTHVTVTFAALASAPTVGWAVALKGVLASAAALPHEYNGSYTITASSTTSVTFASTLTDTVTTLGAATIVPGAFASHGVQMEDIQVDLGNFSGSSNVGVFKTQTYQSNRNGKIVRCFFRNVPGYVLDISDFYNWDISDNRFEVCGNFNLGTGGGILARAVLWNGGGNEAATPSWVANNHFQHALYDVNVFDENSDTGSGFTGKNANWNDTLFIGNVSEQGQYGFNIGTNSQHVTFISPYFEAFGTGTDNYGNAGVGSNCRTIVGKHAAIIGGIWSTITSNATNSTTKGLALSGNLSFDDGATLSTYANMVLTSQIDKATGTFTTSNPATNTNVVLDATMAGGRKYYLVATTDGRIALYDQAASQYQLTVNSSGVTSLGGSKNNAVAARGTLISQSNTVDNTLGSYDWNMYFDTTANAWTYSTTGYGYVLRNDNSGNLILYANGSNTAGSTVGSLTALVTFATGGGMTVNATTDATSISTGALQSKGGLAVTKAAWVGTTLNVAGAATLQSTLAVTGTVTGGTYNGQTISSAASLTGTLSVAGNVTLNAGLTVQNATNPQYTVLNTANGQKYQFGYNLSNTWFGIFDAIASAWRLTIADSTGVVSIPTNIASSSTTTGSLVVAGGVGIAGALNVGGTVAAGTYNGQTISSSANFTGSLTVNGGGHSLNINTTGNFLSANSGYMQWADTNGAAGFVGFGGTSGIFSVMNKLAAATVLGTNNQTNITLNTDKSVTFAGLTQLSLSTGLSAAGTTQGTALALTKEISEITTCASGAGVLLPSSVGTKFIVSNQGANACLVYPTSGAQINSLGSNVGFSLDVGGVIEFIQFSSTQYRALNAVYI